MIKPNNDSIHLVFSVVTRDCKWFDSKSEALQWLKDFNGQGEWDDTPVKFTKDF